MKSKALGELVFDETSESYLSKQIPVAALNDSTASFCFEEFEPTGLGLPEEFENAVANFLGLSADWLDGARVHLRAYYEDATSEMEPEWYEEIGEDEDILAHVDFGDEITVGWDCDENDVYLSIESDCSWELEHGLQLTFRGGSELAKVGPFDGHMTNADAYDDESFRGVIYVRRDML